VNIIEQCTKDCTRDDCSITTDGGMVTCMGWTPTYDKHGNRTDDGDPNIHTQTVRCSTCRWQWTIRTQYGKTEIMNCGKPA
jgi:hypothetical protein